MGDEHLAELPIANIGKCRCEYADDPRAIRRRRQHRRLREKEIAQKDHRTGWENAIERRTPPPHPRTIDGVVVNERSCMEQLNSCAGGYQPVSIIPIRAPGEEQ